MAGKKKSAYEKIAESVPIPQGPAIPERQGPEGVLVPSKVIEALLINVANSHHAAVIDICNQIRAIAEKRG
jgi:hypothetical protein